MVRRVARLARSPLPEDPAGRLGAAGGVAVAVAYVLILAWEAGYSPAGLLAPFAVLVTVVPPETAGDVAALVLPGVLGGVALGALARRRGVTDHRRVLALVGLSASAVVGLAVLSAPAWVLVAAVVAGTPAGVGPGGVAFAALLLFSLAVGGAVVVGTAAPLLAGVGYGAVLLVARR